MGPHVTFPIYHPKHGEAVCDGNCWPEFEEAGWSKTKPASKGKPKAGEAAGTAGKPPAGQVPADKPADGDAGQDDAKA